jgi:hypothetical protein
LRLGLFIVRFFVEVITGFSDFQVVACIRAIDEVLRLSVDQLDFDFGTGSEVVLLAEAIIDDALANRTTMLDFELKCHCGTPFC